LNSSDKFLPKLKKKRVARALAAPGVGCLTCFYLVLSTLGASAQSTKPIYQSESFSVWPDRVVEGSFAAHASSRSVIDSNYPPQGSGNNGKWVLETDLSCYPQTISEYPLLDALYNMSLEELKKNTRDDGAFNAGAKWQGVWTRDVSYSIVLSLAAIEPEAAKASLLYKVKRDRIVQDTGSGGSWPVSSDRVTWALAAWEVYLVTGDRAWLRRSYTVIRNSVLDDQRVVISSSTGLAGGESTFLDWREQTYPRWMEPADIFSSEALGTNAVYYRTYRILGAMARLLGEPSQDWDARADRIKGMINGRFWIGSKGYYGQYLYGRVWQTLSPRVEALGEALTILFDIPVITRQKQMLSSEPLLPYGVPTVFPETPGIPPYHNRSVWPFVQAFWNLAAAKRQDGTALVYGMASIYRAAALFTTNKENFVADTGSFLGTEINSDRQLWSVAGNLAMVYRVLFGMDFRQDGLHLNPVVPEELKGPRVLTNFSYRKMTLDIEVRGFDDHVQAFTLDGKATQAVIPPSLRGRHHVVVELDDRPLHNVQLNLVRSVTAPGTPHVSLQDERITWNPIEGAAQYAVFRNGKRLQDTADTQFQLPSASVSSQYQIAAVDASGTESFLSSPVQAGTPSGVIKAASGRVPAPADDFITLESSGNRSGPLAGAISSSGQYVLSFRYANGSGPVTTDNKCAIRTLFVDGKEIGPIVMPQRGQDRWSDWGDSSSQLVPLEKGNHLFELRLEPYDKNMNGEVNKALIQSMAFSRIE
jgi:hypothetical protein